MRKLDVEAPQRGHPRPPTMAAARRQFWKLWLMPAPISETAPTPSRIVSRRRRSGAPSALPAVRAKPCDVLEGDDHGGDRGGRAVAHQQFLARHAGLVEKAEQRLQRTRRRAVTSTRPFSLATPTTRPGARGGSLRTTVSPVAARGRARVDRDAALLGELDRLRVQDLGARLRQLLHLLVRELGQPARVRDHARVGGVDAVHVAVDLARLRVERGRQRDRGGVGAAAAERRDLALVRDALVAGDDHDLAARPARPARGTAAPRRCARWCASRW